MRPLSFLPFVFAVPALSALVTTTETWVDGDTYVLSITTDAEGDAITRTVSTVSLTGTAATTAATTTNTRGKTTTTTAANGRPTTTTRVVGAEDTTTTAAPMRTTTYWYDPGDGVWTVGTWTASVTADPTVATAVVPEGTIASYATYQSAVNSVVAASAEAAAANGTISGAERTYGVPFDVRGWTVGMGLVGAVVGAVLA